MRITGYGTCIKIYWAHATDENVHAYLTINALSTKNVELAVEVDCTSTKASGGNRRRRAVRDKGP